MTFHPLSASELVARALAQRGVVFQGSIATYKLGGGAAWTAPTCYDAAGNQYPGHCDCSGLLAYAGKWSDPGRGPWNTDAIVADARGAMRRFTLVTRNSAVRPGDLIVKPGPDMDHDGQRDYPGHCGVVTAVHPDFVRGGAGWWEDLEVTHCSGARQHSPDPSRPGHLYGAVRTTDASLWALGGYLIRPLHVTA